MTRLWRQEALTLMNKVKNNVTGKNYLSVSLTFGEQWQLASPRSLDRAIIHHWLPVHGFFVFLGAVVFFLFALSKCQSTAMMGPCWGPAQCAVPPPQWGQARGPARCVSAHGALTSPVNIHIFRHYFVALSAICVCRCINTCSAFQK